MDITALLRAIEAHPSEDAFQSHLSPAQWQRLAPRLERRELHTGELLIRRGDHDRWAYLVERGHLQVFVSGGPPGSHRIAGLRAGCIVGEPALFTAAPRMASVEAISPGTVWGLSAERLALLASEEPTLALALLQAAGAVMARRMRSNLERGIPLT